MIYRLDLTKLDEQKVVLEEHPFSLLSLFEDALEIVSFDCEKKELEMLCDIQVQFQVHSRQIVHCFFSLFVN